MKPCDCKDKVDVQKLTEQGLRINNNAITVGSIMIELAIGNCTMKISHTIFKRFAQWYLEDQKKGK